MSKVYWSMGLAIVLGMASLMASPVTIYELVGRIVGFFVIFYIVLTVLKVQ
jgi:hypothetical protein